MEPLSKRIRLGGDKDEDTDELEFEPEEINALRDPGYQLQKSRAFAALKLKSTWESIFDKYGKDFTNEGDEIDLKTGKVVVNNGHLQSLENSAFGGEATDGDAPSETDSLDEEERIMHGRPIKSTQSRELGKLLPKVGDGRPSIIGGNWPKTSSFQPGHPRLSSMMPRMNMPFGANPVAFGSFAPVYSESLDPSWKVPELPASAFLNSHLSSKSLAAPRKFAVRKSLPAARTSDEEDDDDDILLGPSVSKLKEGPSDVAAGNSSKPPDTEAISATAGAPPDHVDPAPKPSADQSLDKQAEVARNNGTPSPKATSQAPRGRRTSRSAPSSDVVATTAQDPHPQRVKRTERKTSKRAQKSQQAAIAVDKDSKPMPRHVPMQESSPVAATASKSHDIRVCGGEAAVPSEPAVVKRTRGNKKPPGKTPEKTDHGRVANGLPSPSLTLDQPYVQRCLEPGEYICLEPTNLGKIVRKPSKQRLEVRIIQVKSQKVVGDTATAIPPIDHPAHARQEQSPELGERSHFEASSDKCTENDLKAQSIISEPVMARDETDIAADKGTAKALPDAQFFTRNIQDPGYEFSDEDKPMQPKKKAASVRKSQDKLSTGAKGLQKHKTKSLEKTQSKPGTVEPPRPEGVTRRLTRSSTGLANDKTTPVREATTSDQALTPQSREPVPVESSASLSTPSKIETHQPSAQKSESKKSAPNFTTRPSSPLGAWRHPDPSSPPPEEKSSPGTRRPTVPFTTGTANEAGKVPTTPSSRSRSRIITSKRSIISLVSDDEEEDELSLGPEAFTPSGSRRTSVHYLRGSRDTRRISSSGSVRKSTMRRSLMLIGGSSPTKRNGTPVLGRSMNRISMPIRAKVSSASKKAEGHTPSKSRAGRGSLLSPSRAVSPVGSDLVKTPGGTLRRCGENGFRCDRDFCFVCL